MHSRRRTLGDVSSIQNQIIQTANSQGVPSSIALAVAQQESGFNQGAVGSAGELGVFQLEPQYFPGASDLNTNISTGISYLKQLYQQFGDWATALAAYNWGPTNLANAQAAGTPIPGQVQGYVNSVLGIAGAGVSSDTSQTSDTAVATAAAPTGFDPSQVAPYVLAGVVGMGLWLAWR